MNHTLQEQLVKSGLVAENKLTTKKSTPKRSNKRQTDHSRQRTHNRGNAKQSRHKMTATGEIKVEKNFQTLPASNLIQRNAGAAKALKRKIRDFLKTHKVNDPKAELAFHFVSNNFIKRIYVTLKQHNALVQQELAIVPFGEKHFLIPVQHDKILLALDPKLKIIIHNPKSNHEEQGFEEHPVPDDLMW